MYTGVRVISTYSVTGSTMVLIVWHDRDLLSCDLHQPISLVSSWGKLLDKLMYNWLQFFVKSRGLLGELLFGFRKHRSVRDTLKVVDHSIPFYRSDGFPFVFLSFDIRGAFDSVRKTNCIQELYLLGIPLELFHLYGSILSNCVAASSASLPNTTVVFSGNPVRVNFMNRSGLILSIKYPCWDSSSVSLT